MAEYANVRAVHHANVKWTIQELRQTQELNMITVDQFIDVMCHRRPRCTTNRLQRRTIKGLLERHGARVVGDYVAVHGAFIVKELAPEGSLGRVERAQEP